VTSIEHTAYPRLKRTLTPKELDQVYTPTPAELFLAHRTAKGPVATLGFLIHLKVFQRLGYAVATSEIPASIIEYIAACALSIHTDRVTTSSTLSQVPGVLTEQRIFSPREDDMQGRNREQKGQASFLSS